MFTSPMLVAAINWVKWAAIGGLAAAGATAGLAVVTFFLVLATKKIVAGGNAQVLATQDLASHTEMLAKSAEVQAELATEAYRRGIEPVITASGSDPAEDLQTGGITWLLEIENIGNGMAFIEAASMRLNNKSPDSNPVFQEAVAPGATSRVKAVLSPRLTSQGGWIQPPEVNSAVLQLKYRGADRRHYTTKIQWILKGEHWQSRTMESHHEV